MVTTILYSNTKLNWETGKFDTSYLCNNYYCFELIEDKTIDIDNIEEMTLDGVEDVTYFVNDLIKVVKQLDKRVKELEELNIEINEKDINEAINKAREQRNKEIKSIKEKVKLQSNKQT